MVAALVVLSALTLFLLLCVLGAMREAALLRGEVKALADLVRRPPPPSYVNGPIPAALMQALEDPGSERMGPQLVAFVSPGCQPCEALSDGLAAAVANGRAAADDLFFVIWAAREEDAEQLAPRLPGPLAIDAAGTLSRACEIRATPTLLVVSRPGREVIDFNLEGDVEWALSHLTKQEPVPVRA